MARELTANERREIRRHEPGCDLRATVTATCDECGSTLAICDCHEPDVDLDVLMDVISCACPHRPAPVAFGRVAREDSRRLWRTTASVEQLRPRPEHDPIRADEAER